LGKGTRYRTPRFHESGSGIFLLDPDCRFGSVVDRDRFDANPDPDPNFNLMPIQILIRLDWDQNDADPHADTIPSSILLVTAMLVYRTMYYVSH
jgi:hypothetical protein